MIAKLVSVMLLVVMSQVSMAASDPTRPDVLEQSPKSKTLVTQLKLTMIQRSESGSKATINGQSLAVGDFIGGYQLKSIGSNQVILKNNKGQVRLSLITRGTLKKS